MHEVCNLRSAHSTKSEVTLIICRWITQRKAFGGKPLHQLAVIRSKMASMIARAESLQAWLENITYQMNHMNYQVQADKLAGYMIPLPSLALLTNCHL